MPSPNPTVRRQHSGNAVPTTLSAPIVNGTDTSFTIASATGWPDGSVGNFVVTINAGQSDAEKILCSTRTGTTVNVVTRGFDSTTAAGHASTATATHTISALEIDEANQHTNATAAVHGVTGSVVGTSDTQTLTNKAVALGSNTVSGTTAQFNTALSDNDFATLAGSETLTNKTLTTPAITGSGGALTLPAGPDTLVGRTTTDTLTNKTINGGTLDAASTLGGVSGTSLAADRTAWTAYTPTFGGASSPAGTFVYKLIGKTLILSGEFTGGNGSGGGQVSISLPASLTSASGRNQSFYALASGGLSPVPMRIASAATNIFTVGNITGGAALSTNIGAFTAHIEVA